MTVDHGSWILLDTVFYVGMRENVDRVNFLVGRAIFGAHQNRGAALQ